MTFLKSYTNCVFLNKYFFPGTKWKSSFLYQNGCAKLKWYLKAWFDTILKEFECYFDIPDVGTFLQYWGEFFNPMCSFDNTREIYVKLSILIEYILAIGCVGNICQLCCGHYINIFIRRIEMTKTGKKFLSTKLSHTRARMAPWIEWSLDHLKLPNYMCADITDIGGKLTTHDK